MYKRSERFRVAYQLEPPSRTPYTYTDIETGLTLCRCGHGPVAHDNASKRADECNGSYKASGKRTRRKIGQPLLPRQRPDRIVIRRRITPERSGCVVRARAVGPGGSCISVSMPRTAKSSPSRFPSRISTRCRDADALLDQIADPIASFTADGAYDQDQVNQAVAERHPDAVVIAPPRAGAVASASAETAPTQRDHYLRMIAERGRMARQKASGYNRRAKAEASIGLQACDWRCPSIAHRSDRGRPRRGCPEPNVGTRTPEVCPYRLNNRLGWAYCVHPSCLASVQHRRPRRCYSSPAPPSSPWLLSCSSRRLAWGQQIFPRDYRLR
jgi:hypothetical protein